MSIIIATANGLSSVEALTGNLIKNHKTCENIPRGAVLVRSPVSHQAVSLIAVQCDKPLIHHYSLKKETVVKRIVLPAKLESLAIAPNGQWLAAGSKDGTLYVWNLWSGNLQTLFNEAHFQALKCITWSKDGSVLVTGGDDARILVWRTVDLISNENVSPKHIFTTHSLPITSFVMGSGIFRDARLYTASLDATVSAFDIFSGRLLYTLACNTPIHTLAVDAAERALYLGCDDGVHMIPLYYEPKSSTKLIAVGSSDGSVVSTNDIERVLKTESKVSAITLSTDGSHLIVGCEDGSVSSWEVGSGQQVKKYRSTKGSVTDLIYVTGNFAPAEEFAALPVLQRNLSSEIVDFIPYGRLDNLDIENLRQVDKQELENIEISRNSISDHSKKSNELSTQNADTGLAMELKELKERHEQLKKMYDALWSRHTSE